MISLCEEQIEIYFSIHWKYEKFIIHTESIDPVQKTKSESFVHGSKWLIWLIRFPNSTHWLKDPFTLVMEYIIE